MVEFFAVYIIRYIVTGSRVRPDKKNTSLLTNCQTVYSLHENRVFPSDTDFGWKYAIFSAKTQVIPLEIKQIHQARPGKGCNSTRQYQSWNNQTATEKDAKSTVFPVRQLSDWRRTAVGLRTDSCPSRRRTAVGQQTDSCRTTGKHSSSPPISPFSGFYLSNSYENERLKKRLFLYILA